MNDSVVFKLKFHFVVDRNYFFYSTLQSDSSRIQLSGCTWFGRL